MTAIEWVALLDKWGIKHVERNGWASHNRAGHGEFGDMHGIVVHHTGSHNSASSQGDLLWNGYASLPGPLCHAGIAPDGYVYLTGWGRTNHAGLGDSTILNHVIQEDYDASKNLRPTKADKDGNAVFYGFEIMYDGETPMSDAQRKTIVRICAAICTHHNWNAHSVIGHGEWQPGKWDPGAHGKLIDMGSFRSEVAQAIKEGPVPKLPTRPKPPTPNPTGTVTVQAGDTLMGLAEKYLKDPKRWTDIVAANPSLLKSLVPGQKLTLPGK